MRFNLMRKNVTRRTFVKESLLATSALALAGASVSGQSASGAASSAGAPTALPHGKIGKLEVSRLILGGNLLTHYTHSRDLKYVYSAGREVQHG
jgi:hypothetical protein